MQEFDRCDPLGKIRDLSHNPLHEKDGELHDPRLLRELSETGWRNGPLACIAPVHPYRQRDFFLKPRGMGRYVAGERLLPEAKTFEVYRGISPAGCSRVKSW